MFNTPPIKAPLSSEEAPDNKSPNKSLNSAESLFSSAMLSLSFVILLFSSTLIKFRSNSFSASISVTVCKSFCAAVKSTTALLVASITLPSSIRVSTKSEPSVSIDASTNANASVALARSDNSSLYSLSKGASLFISLDIEPLLASS